MCSDVVPTVAIHTSPEDVPSVPPWFAEVALLARYFTQQGHLDAISQHVRLARGRAGIFDVLDFVAILLGYAVSGEATLEAFFDRLAPFAQPFMALFGRDQLPHRATLSRVLAAVDPHLGQPPGPQCLWSVKLELERHPARRVRGTCRRPWPALSLGVLKLVAQPVGVMVQFRLACTLCTPIL